ncbi:GNAT family N-acetyltransferase [Kitasatospora sp. NPDC015120]|uniref:GNAT family N-acetyltransferase n=1 Tax=Kitasatospora sp. NPDC015120 TaxID=3364023 RepID=UPI0036F491A1
MLQSSRIILRARHDDDVPVLHTELHDDVPTRSRADTRPWRPIPPGSPQSPFVVGAGDDEAACFSAVNRASGDLAGEALLWGIDTHQRRAHLGLALRPGFRGRGLSGDIVRLLCHYGFVVRGLHRLQVDTLAGNLPMIKAATGAGFVPEGTLRRAAWVYGAFEDEVVLGLLASEWSGEPRPAEAAGRSSGLTTGV